MSGPSWASTVVAMRFDGAHGSTTLTDLKGHTVTNAGATIARDVCADLPGNNASVKSGGTVSTYFYLPSSADFALGPGDFVIDFFIKGVAVSGRYISAVGLQPASDAHTGWKVLVVNDWVNNVVFTYAGASTFTIPCNPAVNVLDGAMHHIRVLRFSGTIFIDVDGVQKASAANSVDMSISGPIHVGYDARYGGGVNGYFDDLIIAKESGNDRSLRTRRFAANYKLAGTVEDGFGVKLVRTVVAMRESDKAIADMVVSDSGTGAFELVPLDSSAHIVMALDASENAEPKAHVTPVARS